MNAVRIIAVSICAMTFAGCVTDKLAVFKKNLVDQKGMRAYEGDYKVERWPSDKGPMRIRVFEKDGKHRFTYEAEQRVDISFMLSKIPNSKTNLHLMSLPAQKGTNDANMFFIGRVEKEKALMWMVLSNQPVASGKLDKGEKGRMKASELKTFLSKHADEYAKANKPHISMTREKK